MGYPTDIEWTKRFQRWGYSLTWRTTWFHQFVWARIWFRFYCPAPIGDDYSVRSCIAAGRCGCDNGSRRSPDPVTPRKDAS